MASNEETVAAEPTVDLLLIEDDEADAHFVRRALRQELPSVVITHARSLGEATSALQARRFDLVLADHRLPDGSGLEVLDFLREQGTDTPVVVMTGLGGEDVAVAAMKAGAYDYLRKELDQGHLKMLPVKLNEAQRRYRMEQQLKSMERQQEELKLLRTIRSTVATVNHEINNPLAIISGNAQLLLELTRVMDLDPELVKPIEDIEEASQRIAEALFKLVNLKEIITKHYASGESDMIDIAKG